MDRAWTIIVLFFANMVRLNGSATSQGVSEVFDVMPDEDLHDNIRLNEFCQDKLCLRRCCAEGEAIIGTACENYSSSILSDLLHNDPNLDDTTKYSIVNSHERYCSSETGPLPFTLENVALNRNVLNIPELDRSLEYRDFCLEGHVDSDENISVIILACFADERSYQLQRLVSSSFQAMIMSAASCALAMLLFFGVNSVLSIDDCEVIVDISRGVRTLDGKIVHQGVTYTSSDYFSNTSGVFGCACHVLRCVHDCCQSNQVLDTSSGTVTCVSSRNKTTQISDHPALFNIIRVPDRPVCRAHTLVFDFTTDEYVSKLANDNYVKLEETNFHYSNYCVTAQSSDTVKVVVCYLGSNEVELAIAGTGMIISMPFLFITFLVYLILPDKNVHQNALMLYVLTLLLAYILLVTINLSENLPSFFCTGAAYGTIFLFMVSFFWMNVICFDIWYTFSGGRGYIVSSRTSERKRFLIYTSYAIGIPILHVSVVGLLDTYMNEDSIHKPNIGLKKCFLDDGWPTLWYMYGEAAILIVINVIFFTLTALKIRQVKKETSMLKQNESKRHTYEKDKRRFNLFLKLFLAMGVNWSMEVISWLVNWQTADKYTYIWYITDFINAIYGGVIFFIFVFKKKIWKMLQKRYYNFIGKPHLARAVTTTTDIRTSNYSSSADTNLTERTNMTERIHNGTIAEESALHRA